ncbi:hypothetical protein FGO68_gene7691 [Halteria grandinella]|uniref:Cadherin domain-containing protein n=1 Tax=Halteria grandinella TaxID=5974 RepID=A0A8J8P7U8_HALGN|nr:hypothetical protein FGO68_gene7691 [Halteria grandinella]
MRTLINTNNHMLTARVTIFLLEFLTNIDTDPEIYFSYFDASNNDIELNPPSFKPFGGQSSSMNVVCLCYGNSIHMQYVRWRVGSNARFPFYADCDRNYTSSAQIFENDYLYRINFRVASLLPAKPPIITSSTLSAVTIIGGESAQTRTFTAEDDAYQDYDVSASYIGTLPSYITLSGWTFTIAPTANDPSATYTVQYRAFNTYTYSTTQTFTVTVIHNDPPVLVTGISDFSIPVGTAISKTVVATDAQGTTLTLTLGSPLPGFTQITGFQFDFSPQYTELPQVKTISYTISDGVKSIGPYQFTVTIVNLLPSIDQGISDFSMFVGSTITKTLTVSDPEGATVTSSPVLALPSYISKSGHSFTFTPTYLQGNSTYSLQYTISDGPQSVGPNTFQVTVVNRVPAVTSEILDFDKKVGSGPTLKTFVGNDPEGNALVITVTSALPGFITRSGFVFTINPSFSEPAQTVTVTYTISDQVNTLPQFSYQVIVINEPPILNQNIDDFLMYVGSRPISLTLDVTDPEGNTVTSDLSVTLPSYITKLLHEFTFNPLYSQGNSTFTAIYTISDGPNTIGPFNFKIDVENREPVVVSAIQDFSIKVGSGGVDKFFDVYDPDGNAITLVVTSTLPSYITCSGFTFTINPSYAIAAATITVTFTISDGVNTLPQFMFIVTVINDPPIWTEVIVNQKCEVGHVCTYSPGHLDPEGNVVTMTYTGPSFITKLAGNVFQTAAPYSQYPGSVLVQNIILSDGVNFSPPEMFNVLIINLPPDSLTQYDQTMKAGAVRNYYVPPSRDPEHNFIVTTVINLDPIYASFDPATLIITFSPSYIQPPNIRTIYIHYFDGALTTTNLFEFTLINEEPYFNPSLIHQNLVTTFALTYTLPIPTDPEGNTTSFQFLNMQDLPDFACWNEEAKAIQLAPLEGDEYKHFTCIFNISDGLYMLQFLLEINIHPLPILDPVHANNALALYNIGPPYFSSPPSVTLRVSQSILYELPTIIDPDGDQIETPEIQLGSSIPFATLVDMTKIQLYPSKGNEGRYQIKVLLRDRNSYFPLSNELYINIEVQPKGLNAPNPQTPSSLPLPDSEFQNVNKRTKIIRKNVRLWNGKIDTTGAYAIKFNPDLPFKLITQLQASKPFKLTIVPPSWNGNNPTLSQLALSIQRDPTSCIQLDYTITSANTKQLKLQVDVKTIGALPLRQVSQTRIIRLFSKIIMSFWS